MFSFFSLFVFCSLIPTDYFGFVESDPSMMWRSWKPQWRIDAIKQWFPWISCCWPWSLLKKIMELCNTAALIIELCRVQNMSDTRAGHVYFKEFVTYLRVVSISVLPCPCNIVMENEHLAWWLALLSFFFLLRLAWWCVCANFAAELFRKKYIRYCFMVR